MKNILKIFILAIVVLAIGSCDFLGFIVDNEAPVADAGTDFAATVGQTVTLDGSRSYDNDGDRLTFRWNGTDPDGDDVTADISNRLNEEATITLTKSGTYSFIITVDDGLDEDTDTVNVTVTGGGTGGNSVPVADAGADFSATVGESITLDGSNSFDADGDILTFQWTGTAPGGIDIGTQISNAATEIAAFTVSLVGDYVFTLTVDDGTDLASDTVTVTVTDTGGVNTPPVADAGPDFSSNIGQTIILDGTASFDPDTDPLSYNWTGLSPSGIDISAQISNAVDALASFTLSELGNYIFTLTVSDGSVSDSATVVVLVIDNELTTFSSQSGTITDSETQYFYIASTVYYGYDISLAMTSGDADLAVYGSDDQFFDAGLDVFMYSSAAAGDDAITVTSNHLFDYLIVEVIGWDPVSNFTLSLTEAPAGSYATILSNNIDYGIGMGGGTINFTANDFFRVERTFYAWSVPVDPIMSFFDIDLSMFDGNFDLEIYGSSDQFLDLDDTFITASTNGGTTAESITNLDGIAYNYLIIMVVAFEAGSLQTLSVATN